MSDPESLKKFDARKMLTLIALMGAAVSAYFAGNYLSYAGITYYVICAAAILFNYRKAGLLLWGAVAAHAVLVGYGLLNWQTARVVPCIYCFGAAGFALLAAVVYTRLAAAIAPALLIVITWYAWPYAFADKGQAGVIQQQTQNQTTEQQVGNQPAVVKPDAAGDTGKTEPGAQAGNAAAQSENKQGQDEVSTPAAANPDSGQGGNTAANNPGNSTPEEKPGSGTTDKPADPEKPGST